MIIYMRIYECNHGLLNLIEIVFVSIRGALGSTAIVSANIGVVIAMALGTYFDYKATPICAILLTVLFGVIFFFFPETPIFLVKHNKISVRCEIYVNTN